MVSCGLSMATHLSVVNRTGRRGLGPDQAAENSGDTRHPAMTDWIIEDRGGGGKSGCQVGKTLPRDSQVKKVKVRSALKGQFASPDCLLVFGGADFIRNPIGGSLPLRIDNEPRRNRGW